MNWLRELRIAKGKTQSDVAGACRITRSYYANIELGKRGKHLPVGLAKLIALELGFSWTKFYDNEKTAG